MYREKPSGKNLHKLPENETKGCIHSIILPAASETCVLPLVLPRPGLVSDNIDTNGFKK